MIRGIRHSGIVVRDLEKSANFYRMLGFVNNKNAIEQGLFIDQVTGLKDVKLEWIKLKAPDGNLIELLKYHSHPESKEIENQKSNKLGSSHIAFTVDNIDEMCNLIKKAGGSIINPPAISSDERVKVSYCHDPEGVLIEIVEVL